MSTNSHIAILGAGPTGLEAALAASDHGYSFTLYEASRGVAGHVRDWGHVRLFSPWSIDLSQRMRRHLEAAGHQLPAPDSNECPTGAELCERVLEPIGRLPHMEPHLKTGVRVVEVGREGLLKHEEIGTGERARHNFRLLLRDRRGREWVERAHVVIDCTGTWSHPNAMGNGGISAPGENSLVEPLLCRRIPDFAADREEWSGKKVLLVGAGHSAQTAVRDLADLAARAPGTRVVWALRSRHPSWAIDPDDPLPGRAQLTERARELAAGASAAVEPLSGVVVDSLERAGDGRVRVTLRRHDGDVMAVEVDRVLALTGSVGDHRLYRQLQVHECYATSGPMKLAAALLGADSQDCLEQESQGVEALTNPEPDFFILGSKSYGRNNTFLMRVGWQQVEEVFSTLGNGVG